MNEEKILKYAFAVILFFLFCWQYITYTKLLSLMSLNNTTYTVYYQVCLDETGMVKRIVNEKDFKKTDLKLTKANFKI